MMDNSLPVQTYRVQAGDSLYKIALQFGTTVSALKTVNHLTSDMVLIGQVLQIPTLTLPEGMYGIGSTGLQVKTLRSVLVSLGFNLMVDGIYGTRTANVILQLQQKFPMIKGWGLWSANKIILTIADQFELSSRF